MSADAISPGASSLVRRDERADSPRVDVRQLGTIDDDQAGAIDRGPEFLYCGAIQFAHQLDVLRGPDRYAQRHVRDPAVPMKPYEDHGTEGHTTGPPTVGRRRDSNHGK